MYPQILKNLKQKIAHLVSAFHLNLNHKSHPQGRKLKIDNEDALTLALYRHTSTRVTKKSVWDDFKNTLSCSYKTLVCALNRVAAWSMKILFLLMRMGKRYGHLVKYTDATDLPVCLKKNADAHRTMRALAGFGHSAKGWYYGLKMTMTRDMSGNILGLRFTAPTVNDRVIFRSVNKDIFGVIVADAGYVSKQLERDMWIEGKRWTLIRPYRTMKKLMTKWQERLYRSRFMIEFDFRSLKLFHGLVTSLPRSVNGYLAHYLHSILSFVLA